MKRRVVIFVIAVISAAVFVGIAVYGWMHRFGPPGGVEEARFPALRVPYQARSLRLAPEDVWSETWNRVPAVEITLVHQVTETPWPKSLVPKVEVRAFHDGNDIYFRLQWADDSASRSTGPNQFPDACAVMLPLKSEPPSQSIMMGFSSLANIWYWRADLDAEFWDGVAPSQPAFADHHYPFEKQEVQPITTPAVASAVQDLLGGRPGSLTRKERQLAEGRGLWKEGRWAVVFKRSRKTSDAEREAQVVDGRMAVAFAVWNGEQGDRGARKSISDWVMLDIEGQVAPVNQDSPRAAKAWSFTLLSEAQAAAAEFEPVSEPEPRLINIMAKRFEYTPSEITVQKGDLIALRLESLDVTHGLYLDGYNIQMKARPGLVDKAVFRAYKTGRFAFRCSETCGEFHPYMIGYLTVEPNTRFGVFAISLVISFVVLCLVIIFVARKRGTA